MNEDPKQTELEAAIAEVLSARDALMRVITHLHGNQDTGKTYAYFLKDDETARKQFVQWLPTMEYKQGPLKEKASAYIITALYAPTLTSLAARFAADQKVTFSGDDSEADIKERWDIATAYVSTWKLIEMHLRERYANMPEGDIKQHLAPVVEHISNSFKTVLPSRSSVH